MGDTAATTDDSKAPISGLVSDDGDFQEMEWTQEEEKRLVRKYVLLPPLLQPV